MRNRILIIFTLALCFLAFSKSNAQSLSEESNDFFDVVLSDSSRHSKFVLVDIESDEYTGKAIIENADLFYFLNQTKEFNLNQYKTFMKDLLLKKSKLSLGNSNLNKWHFIKVKKIEEVENFAINGKNELIEHYFDRVKNIDFDVCIIKKGIDDDERNAVIAKLFQWKIISQVDDETGYLIINLMK